MTEIPPVLLSAIICDRAIFDKISGMPSLINIIQNINAPKYPVRSRLVFFCELTNGHGSTKTKIRVVEARRDDKVILEIKVTPAITKSIQDQVYYYVKGTKYRLVLLANFGTDKVNIKRLIYS